MKPDELWGWEYVGLSGKPGLENAVRRFTNGDWALEVRALKDPGAPTRVVSIRTLAEDNAHWAETRSRLLKAKDRRS
ncbi:MAG: hypothetical protein R3E84_05030 [Pseudomonadales bacterium]|nr:hypothetical protein [Pseudomonadales bacterium]